MKGVPSSAYPYLRRIVRALRKRRGWTQEVLAENAGCDYKYFQLFEAGGTAAPTISTVEKLAKALGTKPWILLCDDVALIEKLTGLPRDEFLKPPAKKLGRPRKDEVR